MSKFLERKFTVPGMAGLLPIANELGSFGLDFKTLCLVGVMALGWAAIEAFQDIARMKFAAADKAATPVAK